MNERELVRLLDNALRSAGLDTYYSANQTVAERIVAQPIIQELLDQQRKLV